MVHDGDSVRVALEGTGLGVCTGIVVASGLRSGCRVGCDPSIDAVLRATAAAIVWDSFSIREFLTKGRHAWKRPLKGQGSVRAITMVSTPK